MTEKQASSYQRRGETTGSPQRPAEQLAAPVLTFDLAAQLEQLRHEASWEHADHNADTLVHEPDLRIVLMALRPGARIHEHRTDGRLSIQALAGRLRLHLPHQTVELPAGHLLALEPGIAHDVEALEDSTLLLTLVWPAGRGEG